MKWLEIVAALESYARVEPRRALPNAIHILDSGFFLFGDERQASCFNAHQEEFVNVKVHGAPDREGIELFHFYSHLLTLMQNTEVQKPTLERYFQLPLIAADRSYSFVLGMFAEVGLCERHGHFARRIATDDLEKVASWCRTVEPINWIRAIDLAYGKPENEEAYRRQPGDVRIYNPEDHALGDILLTDSELDGQLIKSLAFDMIDTDRMRIYLPYYYSSKYNLISTCPKCAASTTQRSRKTPRNTDNSKSRSG